MPRSLVLLIYNIALPVFFVLAFPAWLIKMWRRGGYGTGLSERFAIFQQPASEEPRGVMYIHAVSVGEVLIAIKLIAAILQKNPDQRVVLAATTSTGHAVAREKSPQGVRVIYSPLDFNFIVRAVLRRFKPKHIVLIEAEAWPNLLRIAQKKHIPVTIVNARLSERSESRYQQFNRLIKPIFEMITKMGVQDHGDRERFKNLGINPEKIHVTGSIKFDASDGQLPEKREEFQKLLNDFGYGLQKEQRPVILVASTHAGEEKMIAAAVKQSGVEATLVIVPRHAERRAEVVADLVSVGYDPILRTDYQIPQDPEKSCLVADTTGELRDWTAHADLVIIGKSWLGRGGQNPAEAIVAGKPVICGPHMGNFQPLVRQLCAKEAVVMLKDGDALASILPSLLKGGNDLDKMVERAREVLSSHNNALEKTLELLEVNASVRDEKRVEGRSQS